MKRWEKIFSRLIIVGVLLIMLAGSYWLNRNNASYVLKVGVYSGSYWDTPNADCYHILDMAIERFEEMHPNIKVEYASGINSDDYSEWLIEQIMLGQEPDLYFVLPEDFSLLASSGALADLDELMREDDSFDSTDYYEPCLKAGEYNNIQYALPQESVPTIMFVNKTILEENGIDFPKSDWTWEDFYKICKEVTDIENHRYGAYDYTWLNALYTNGTSLFSDDHSQCLLTSPEVTDAIEFAKKINDLNEGYMVTARDFDIGNVAFRPFLYSEYRAYQPYPWRVKVYSGFDWDGITMPSGKEGGNDSELHTMLLGISSGTKHKDAAWEFTKLLSCDKEIQKSLSVFSSGISPLISVAEDPKIVALMKDKIPGGIVFDRGMIHDIMSSAVLIPYFSGYERALNMADTAVSEMINKGTFNIDDLISVQREVNQYLKK